MLVLLAFDVDPYVLEPSGVMLPLPRRQPLRLAQALLALRVDVGRQEPLLRIEPRERLLTQRAFGLDRDPRGDVPGRDR